MILYGEHYQRFVGNMNMNTNSSKPKQQNDESAESDNSHKGDGDEKQSESKGTKESNERVLSVIKQRAKDQSEGRCGSAVRIHLDTSRCSWVTATRRSRADRKGKLNIFPISSKMGWSHGRTGSMVASPCIASSDTPCWWWIWVCNNKRPLIP